MPNWKFAADGLGGGIVETDEEPDGDTIFATFTEARDGLASWFSYVGDAYKEAAKRARKLRRPIGGDSVHITAI